MSAYDNFNSGDTIISPQEDDGIVVWERQEYLIVQVTENKVMMENKETGNEHPPLNYEFLLDQIDEGDLIHEQ